MPTVSSPACQIEAGLLASTSAMSGEMTTPVNVVNAKSASRFSPRTWRTACAPITPPIMAKNMMNGCS